MSDPRDNGHGFARAVAPIPLAEFRDRVLDLYRPPLRAHGTHLKMRQVLGILAALGVKTTADFTAVMVARFIASRPPESPNTTHGLVSCLRTLCNHAAAEGLVYVSPFALRKRWVRRAPTMRKQHHSREDIARVLDLLRREVQERTGWARWRSHRLYALAATFAYTGLRRNEGLFLTAPDLDFDARLILIRPRVGQRLKTEAAAQPVPMPDPLVPILTDWMAHRLDDPGLVVYESGQVVARRPPDPACPWVFPNLMRSGAWTGGPPGHKPLHRIVQAGRRAGVEGLTFQSLRHSWATHAEYWGLSDAQIQRVLRHTNARTQWHYRHADGENLRASVRNVDFGGAAP